MRPYIVIDPAQNFGQPAIARTRVQIAHIIDWLESGDLVHVVQDEYGLTRADLLVACWFEARYGTGAHPRDEWLDWLEDHEPALWSAKGYEEIPFPPMKHRPASAESRDDRANDTSTREPK
ncbi:DUF433 domain-containing protein [Acrocarpospora sp. B8E8]